MSNTLVPTSQMSGGYLILCFVLYDNVSVGKKQQKLHEQKLYNFCLLYDFRQLTDYQRCCWLISTYCLKVLWWFWQWFQDTAELQQTHDEKLFDQPWPKWLRLWAGASMGSWNSRSQTSRHCRAERLWLGTYWMSASCLCVEPSPHMYSAHNNGYSIWGQ